MFKVLKYKVVRFLALFLFVSLNLFSQTDTEFWFVAPEVTVGHGDNPIYLRLTSFGAAATVTIDQPANPAFIPIVVNIPINGTSTIDLTPWKNTDIENYAFNNVAPYTYVDLKENNFGIHIVATNPITAYYEVARSNNPDIFTLKGSNALGTYFMIPTQNYIDNRGTLTPDARSGFDIVATEDNTTITIYPTKTIEVGHSTPYTIILNRGETYSATAASRLAANHLFGTRVISDKPIAITIKDDSVYGNPCYDLMGDQIVPISLLGTEYIAIKGSLTAQEGICIIAPYDNTSIYINGNPVAVSTINSGGIYKFTIPGAAGTSTFIETILPAYVLQVTGFGCETGQAVLPPATCTGSDKVAFARTSNEGFGLILFTENAAVGNFTINSGGLITNIPAASFTAVPGSTTFSAAFLWWNLNDFSVVQQTVQTTVSNSTTKFHCGVINGGSNTGCRYGYFSNYNTFDLGNNDITFNGCGYTLDAGDWDTYLWNTGETTQIITAQDSGWYWVQAQKASCSQTDSIYIAYTPPITLGNDTSICYADSIILDIGNTFDYYEWSTGVADSTTNAITVAGGTFSVTVTDHYGCVSTASIKIEEPPDLTGTITSSDVKCNGGSDGVANLTVAGGFPPYSYLWSNSEVTEDISALSPGNYSVTITDNISCSITSSATISNPSLLSSSITISDVTCFENSDGIADLTVLGGTSPYTFNWDNGSTTEDLSNLSAGIYIVTISDANLCSASSSTTISKPSAALSAYIIANNVSCKGGSNGSSDVTVSGGTSPYTYLWSNGALTKNITGLSAGTYNLTVTDANLCTTAATVSISEPLASLTASISKTDVSCFGTVTGSVDLTVSGGTQDYNFLWNIGQITEDISGIGVGIYTVTITDNNGCTEISSVTINEPNEIIVDANVNNITCYGGSDGSISLNVIGGTSPYTFVWSNGQISSSILGLTAGSYQVTVTDSMSCISVSEVIIN